MLFVQLRDKELSGGYMQKLIFTLGLIILGLVSGYVLQQIIRKKVDQYDLLLPRPVSYTHLTLPTILLV